MFVIFGNGTKVEKWQYIGRRFCRTCQGFTNFYIGRKIFYFSIFFIPIVRITKAYYLMCNSCDCGYELTKEQALNLRKEFEHLPSPEQITSLLTYIMNEAKTCEFMEAKKAAILEYAKVHYGIRENIDYVKKMIDDVFVVEKGRVESELSETNNA